jgi:hypothetical protein
MTNLALLVSGIFRFIAAAAAIVARVQVSGEFQSLACRVALFTHESFSPSPAFFRSTS